MSEKEKYSTDNIILLGIAKEDVGDGWSPGYSLSEYEIPKHQFTKHCKRISRTEPDILPVLITNLTKKARDLLGI